MLLKLGMFSIGPCSLRPKKDLWKIALCIAYRRPPAALPMSHTGGLRQPCQRRIPEASGGFINVCCIPEASGGFVHVYSSCCNARKVVDIDSNSDIDMDICLAFRKASEAPGRRLGGLSCGPGGLRGAPRRGPESTYDSWSTRHRHSPA